MKYKIPVIFVLLLFFVPKGGASAPKSGTKPVLAASAPVIDAVSDSSVTVKTSKHSKTYKIVTTGAYITLIICKGRPIPVADLKPGMLVSVTQGWNTEEAAVINVRDAPKIKETPAQP